MKFITFKGVTGDVIINIENIVTAKPAADKDGMHIIGVTEIIVAAGANIAQAMVKHDLATVEGMLRMAWDEERAGLQRGG